ESIERSIKDIHIESANICAHSKFNYRNLIQNPATFSVVHVTSSPLQLSYSSLILAFCQESIERSIKDIHIESANICAHSKFNYRNLIQNPATFSVVHVTSSPLQLSYSSLILAFCQIDLLENQAIDNVVVLSVVLDEVKNRNRSMYNRIRALCSNQAKQFYVFSNHVHKDTYVQVMERETAHDHNDRDVFVHRLLAASLRIYKLPTVFQDRPQLTSVADNKFLLYPPWIQGFSLFRIFGHGLVKTKRKIFWCCRPTDAETRVAKLRSNGFILFVPKYEIEGPVYVTAKGEKRGGDWYVDEENQKIV
ncbi:hypothetical protein F2Q69_00057912, partial [Brassica cretica]